MRDAIAAGVLLLLLAGLAWLRPPAQRLAPPLLPAASCEPWMADAIPGVGPKTRERAAARIHAGQVPPAAAGWFTR